MLTERDVSYVLMFEQCDAKLRPLRKVLRSRTMRKLQLPFRNSNLLSSLHLCTTRLPQCAPCCYYDIKLERTSFIPTKIVHVADHRQTDCLQPQSSRELN